MKKEKVKKLVSRLPSHSAKMEVLVATLLSDDILKIDDVYYLAESLFKRSYTEDILAQEFDETKKILHLYLNREGIYDQLPSAFFHSPEPLRPDKPIDEMIVENQQIREQEKEARKFFRPFEQEFLRKRVEIELFERKHSFGFLNSIQRKLLYSIWPDTKAAPAQIKPLLSYLLPLAYKIAGNIILMQACFSTLLMEKVEVEKGMIQTQLEPEEDEANLREWRLGLNSVLSSTSYISTPCIKLTIGPIGKGQISNFLPGGSKLVVLDLIKDNFIPIDYNFSYELVAENNYKTFSLGDNKISGRLGISTYIQ